MRQVLRHILPLAALVSGRDSKIKPCWNTRRLLCLTRLTSAGRMGLGRVLHYAGRSEEAIDPIEQAMTLEPYYPGYYLHVLAQAQFQLGRYEAAIESLTRRITRDPKTDISRVLLAASYGHLNRIAEARFEWAEALRVN